LTRLLRRLPDGGELAVLVGRLVPCLLDGPQAERDGGVALGLGG